MAKQLSELVPDLREALEEGMRDAATGITNALKKRGPYWSGDVEKGWQVSVGQEPVPNNVKARDFSEVPERQPRPETPVLVGTTIHCQASRAPWIR